LRVVAIIQARMGSTRLPGKVLLDLAGETVLARVVNHVRRSHLIAETLVATTNHSADDPIVEECRMFGVAISRGDENDVLDRYFQAAQALSAEAVVRITSDCPLIDPEITDKTIAAFLASRPDYASNVLERTYPRGLDTEVFSMDALGRAWSEAREPYEREHVTPYIHEHPEKFKLLSVTGDEDHSDHRWTVDTPEDLEFVRAVYARVGNKTEFSWRDVLSVLDRHPELSEINRSVTQKALHRG
jgi:spore coat polysaccharide biosynthesis protein SpsF